MDVDHVSSSVCVSMPDPSNDSPISEDSDDSLCDIAAEKEDLDAIGPFYFETARLAFKANTDYKNLVQTIVTLKSQKAQAKRDKKELEKIKKEALADPFLFVEKIKQKQLVFPRKQIITQIPSIDWSKYTTSETKTTLKHWQIKPLSSIKSCRTKKKMNNADNPASSILLTFNEPWSEEEQKRLESLLIQFPPEEVEKRRWEKIAFALGTRTSKQVASKVQKHFIKLMKAGEPIPGRIPNSNCLKVKNRKTNPQEHPSAEIIDVSDDDDVQPELRETSEYKELMFMKKILKSKMQQSLPT